MPKWRYNTVLWYNTVLTTSVDKSKRSSFISANHPCCECQFFCFCNTDFSGVKKGHCGRLYPQYNCIIKILPTEVFQTRVQEVKLGFINNIMTSAKIRRATCFNNKDKILTIWMFIDAYKNNTIRDRSVQSKSKVLQVKSSILWFSTYCFFLYRWCKYWLFIPYQWPVIWTCGRGSGK